MDILSTFFNCFFAFGLLINGLMLHYNRGPQRALITGHLSADIAHEARYNFLPFFNLKHPVT